MGAGSDIQSKAEVIENSYLRDSYGIERLLKSVFTIAEKSRYQFDPSATTFIADLEAALDTDIFTPLERQSITLTYYAQLNIRQAAKLLDVKTYDIIDATAESIEKIAAVLMGYRTNELPAYPRAKYSLVDWIAAVGNGKAPIYMIPEDVNTELLRWLAEHGDDLAEEALRQREEGPPLFIDERSEAEQYPCYTWDQLRDMDRKLSLSFLPKTKLDKIALGRTVVGGRKMAFYDDEGEDGEQKGNHVMRVVNAKIYK
jgi:hypothetical protein